MKEPKGFQIPEPLTEEIKQELCQCRDDLIEILRTFFNTKILLRDTSSIKDFTKYLNRYFASELQFLIERKGFKPDIEKIIAKIESDLGEEDP